MRKSGSNSIETRRLLRAAALKLLFKHGYERMNLRMLAKSVGIRVGSLYNYFDSKQELLFWLLTDSHERMRLKVETIPVSEIDPEVGIRNFIALHLGHLLADPEEANILSMEAAHRLSRKNFRLYSQMQRDYTDKLCTIIQNGVATGKFRTSNSTLAGFAALQMMNTVIRWYRPDGPLSPEKLVALYTEFILSMLSSLAVSSSGNKLSRKLRGVNYSKTLATAK